MAFDIQLLYDRATQVTHRIAPVRFARAVSGFSWSTAPDLDDRGFTPVGNDPANGPSIGITRGREIHVRVVRDRVENGTTLYPVVEDESVAQVIWPTRGSAVSPVDVTSGGRVVRKADCIYLQSGSATGGDKKTKLTLHYGSQSGPKVAEMTIWSYARVTIRVKAHRVSINGQNATTTEADVRRWFRMVNRIFAQAGIRFNVVAGYKQEIITGYAMAGTVLLTATADSNNPELQGVLRTNPVANHLNAYFVDHYFDNNNTNGGPLGTLDEVLGIAFSRTAARAAPPSPGFVGAQAGITCRHTANDVEAAHTIAHEIGHALKLEHYAEGNGELGTWRDQRRDIWAHRCLMHNIVGLSTWEDPAAYYKSTAARIQVGYGNISAGVPCTGQLIGTKRLSGIPQSDQIRVIRSAARRREYAPI